MPGKRKRTSPYLLTNKYARGRGSRYYARKYAYGARRIPPAVPGYTRQSGFYGRYARGAGPAEQKFFDTTLNFTVDATGEVPATGQLTLIPQGVTESTRVGRKCVIKSVTIHAGAYLVPAATATSSGVVSMFLVLDKQCNGAAAANADVWSSGDLNIAMRNLANSSRFVVLKKWKFGINSQAGATTAYNNQSRPLDYYKKCNIPIEYSSTTGAITEIKSNNLFLMAGCNALLDDLVTISGTCRLRFSDS